MVEPSLFAHRAFPAALITSTLFFAVVNGLVVVLQVPLGLGRYAQTAGLTSLPWSVGLAVSSWIARAYLVPRFGSRLLYAGLALLLAGVLSAIVVYRTSDPATLPRLLLAALAVAGLGIGIGIGLFTTPFFTAALRGVSPQETGSAAGPLNAVQQIDGGSHSGGCHSGGSDREAAQDFSRDVRRISPARCFASVRFTAASDSPARRTKPNPAHSVKPRHVWTQDSSAPRIPAVRRPAAVD
jgi:hypothetical protein